MLIKVANKYLGKYSWKHWEHVRDWVRGENILESSIYSLLPGTSLTIAWDHVKHDCLKFCVVDNGAVNSSGKGQVWRPCEFLNHIFISAAVV